MWEKINIRNSGIHEMYWVSFLCEASRLTTLFTSCCPSFIVFTVSILSHIRCKHSELFHTPIHFFRYTTLLNPQNIISEEMMPWAWSTGRVVLCWVAVLSLWFQNILPHKEPFGIQFFKIFVKRNIVLECVIIKSSLQVWQYKSQTWHLVLKWSSDASDTSILWFFDSAHSLLFHTTC
jgi:hypothetical protein